MRITDIRADTLSIGPTIVRVFTDEGIVGLSEIGWHDPAMFRPHLERVIKPMLIGEDPLQVERHWERLYHGTHQRPYPTPVWYIGAIDIALWGHGQGRGPAAPRPPGWRGADHDPAVLEHRQWRQPHAGADAQRPARRWTKGYRAFKIRMDWGPLRIDADPAKDRAMVRLCSESLPPGTRPGFDANRGYSVSTAIRQGRVLEELGVAHFEEPLPSHDRPGVRTVAAALDIPVSTGENEHDRWAFRDLIALGDPDILQPDILDAGGITEVRRIFELAALHGKPVMPHSPATGIRSPPPRSSTARSRPRRSRTSCPPSTAPRPISLRSCWAPTSCPHDGTISMSDAPGLGLTLDERVLERLLGPVDPEAFAMTRPRDLAWRFPPPLRPQADHRPGSPGQRDAQLRALHGRTGTRDRPHPVRLVGGVAGVQVRAAHHGVLQDPKRPQVPQRRHERDRLRHPVEREHREGPGVRVLDGDRIHGRHVALALHRVGRPHRLQPQHRAAGAVNTSRTGQKVACRQAGRRASGWARSRSPAARGTRSRRGPRSAAAPAAGRPPSAHRPTCRRPPRSPVHGGRPSPAACWGLDATCHTFHSSTASEMRLRLFRRAATASAVAITDRIWRSNASGAASHAPTVG